VLDKAGAFPSKPQFHILTSLLQYIFHICATLANDTLANLELTIVLDSDQEGARILSISSTTTA
jgi:hypothetical protein